MKNRNFVLVAIFIVALTMNIGAADSIKVGDTTYDRVIIKESPQRYYVQIPAEGKVISFNKEEVRADNVKFSPDIDLKQKLLAEWKKNNDQSWSYEITAIKAEAPAGVEISAPGKPAESTSPETKTPQTPAVKILKLTGNSRFKESDLVPMKAEIAIDGQVYSVNLNNVPLGEALRALLRTMNLDYAVQNGFIWISTPEIIRAESFEELETRYYGLRAGGNTLPKIVVRNAVYGAGAGILVGPQVIPQAAGGQFRPGYSSGQGVGGVGGQLGQGVGGQGQGFGGQPGFGQMPGGTGLAPGAFYGPGYSGPHFISLVEFFSTIDDRLVGETPAWIGK